MHWLDIVAAIILILAILKGLFDGFVKQVISILGIVFAIYVTILLGPIVGRFIPSINNDPMLVKVIGYSLTFIFTIIITYIGQRVLSALIKTTPFGLFDKLLGGLLGLLGAFLIIGALGTAWISVAPYFNVPYQPEEFVIFSKILEHFGTFSPMHLFSHCSMNT